MSYVYLLHLDRPMGRPQSEEARAMHGLPPRQREYTPHAQHYTGLAECLATRIQQQTVGGRAAAAFCRAARLLGIRFKVARVWHGGPDLERQIKSWKMGRRLCPVCNPAVKPTEFELTPAEIQAALIAF